MIRKIIKIDQDACNGCGLCAAACHEGAIGMAEGKAVLLRDDYCDGLGDCLPACPTGAISFEEREAADYNEAAVKARMAGRMNTHQAAPKERIPNGLKNWPIQIKLVPVKAPWFDQAGLLVAADCTAFAYAKFHDELMKNKVTVIGCPKLDHEDYSEKLGAIIKENNIKSVTIVRMEVPCCCGIEHAAVKALKESGKMIPWQVVTVSTGGEILAD